MITAWYLSPDDFGIYAIALGVTTFTLLMRGGGTSIVYQTMRPSEYAVLGGGLFRIAMTFAILGALFTLGAALPAQSYYNQKSLGLILVLMALLVILNHLFIYPRSKMLSQLLFKEMAWIDVVGSLVKLTVAFLLARSGWGALTFIYAQIAAVMTQIILTTIWARFDRKDFLVKKNWLPPTLTLIKYPLAISVLLTLTEQVDAFIASLFIPLASLGIYFFSASLVSQPIRLISTTLSNVLAPFAARARDNFLLEKKNIASTFTSSMIFLPLFIFGIAAIYPSLEKLVWGEKWQASIWPVIFTAFFLVYPTVQGVLEGPLIGLRRWRLYIHLLSWRAGSKIIGALLAILVIKFFDIADSYIAVTLVIGVGSLSSISAIIQIRRVLHTFTVDQEMTNYELYATPLYAFLAVIATEGVVSSIMSNLALKTSNLMYVAAMELGLSILIFGGTSIVLLRFAYITKLKIVIALLPKTARDLSCKLLKIPQSELALTKEELQRD